MPRSGPRRRQAMVAHMETPFGDYGSRPLERELIGPDGLIELSGRSFDLLDALPEPLSSRSTRAALFDAVWPGVTVEENTLQVHMSALRKALGPGFIATVHGRGYNMSVPPLGEDDEPCDPPPPAPTATAGAIAPTASRAKPKSNGGAPARQPAPAGQHPRPRRRRKDHAAGRRDAKRARSGRWRRVDGRSRFARQRRVHRERLDPDPRRAVPRRQPLASSRSSSI